ncbi:MAG: hypothetical protein IT266_03710 [Saprospiraceae bacterium]|nr:hypothetical protein [Saprospiraceae bacterium]
MLRSVLFAATSLATGSLLSAQECIDTVQPEVTILSKEMLEAPDCLFTVRFCLRKTDGEADFIDYTVIHSYGAIVRSVGVANFPPGTVICQDFTFVAECDAHASFLAEARLQDTTLCGTVYAYASLPLHLLEFRGEALNRGQVLLQWQTVRESHVSHFEVMAGFDGRHFLAAGQVMAKGKGDVPASYHQVWNLPEEATAEAVYFRLKMVDLDGSFSYSRLVRVALEAKPGPVVYPVPANGQLCILGEDRNRTAALAVDLMGRSTRLPPLEGNCFDIRSLPAGFYHLQIGHQSIPFSVR